MRVPKEEWVRMGIKSPVDFWQSWGFVRANYCDPMTARDLCPKKCWECEPHLKEAIEKTNRPDVKKPVGLLIYALRELLARQQERIHPEKSVERDKYDPQENPYDKFLEDLK
jgi:hypothetical protein